MCKLMIGSRSAFAAAILFWAAAGIAAGDHPAVPADEDVLLDRVERSIAKEPDYASAPRYALLVFGTDAEAKVWIVEDGERLYVDWNGSGDLTDGGPPIEPSNVRDLGQSPSGTPRRDFDYLVDEITPPDGSRHTAFRLARWNYGGEQDGYGISVRLNGQTPMYAGWTAFWAASPGDAPLIHFGGPLEPRLLRYKEFVVGSEPKRLSIAFINPGHGSGAHSRLSIDALPPTVIPVVQITWPVADGASPLVTTHPLKQRCCYWEFYALDFAVPDAAIPGTAIVKVSLLGGVHPLPLTTDQFEVPVRAGDLAAADE